VTDLWIEFKEKTASGEEKREVEEERESFMR